MGRRGIRVLLVVGVLAAAVGGLAGPSAASFAAQADDGARPDPDEVVGAEVRAAAANGDDVDVVVMLHDDQAVGAQGGGGLAELRERARAAQERVIDGAGEGVNVRRRFKTVPAFVARVTPDALARLAADPEVRRVDTDGGAGTGSLATVVPLMDADVLQGQGLRGDGVTVAVLDSGYDRDHPDLAGAAIYESCFGNDFTGAGFCPNGTTRQTGAGATEDDAGHGTHVTGIVTSDGAVSSVGVAPGTDIVSVKVTDGCSFSGCFYGFSEVTAALDDLASRPELGIDLVNMSLGTNALFAGDCDSATSWLMAGAAAINNLRSAGVLAFASAGNDSSTTQMTAPACLSNVMAVGATTSSDTVASFSNTSTTTDIVAPGVSVVSDAIGGGTTTASGTSMASPASAGCAALLKQGFPAATPDQIEAALETTGPVVTRGANSYRRVDCDDAFSSLAGVGARYVAMAPCRIVDTRLAGGALPAATQRTYQVAGAGSGFSVQGGKAGGCGVPDTATSVEATITAVGPTGAGFARAWPAGTPLPNATFLNYASGESVGNTGTIPLTVGPALDDMTVGNFGGSTHLVIDIQGYFAPNGAVSYSSVTPCRLVDTRAAGGSFGAGAQRTYQVAGSGSGFAAQGGAAGGCGIPSTAVAVEATITAVGPAGDGFDRAWPAGTTLPNATFLNFTSGESIGNTGTLSIATTAARSDLTVGNFGGATHIVIDVQGYYSTGSNLRYIAVTPCRIVDTRAVGGTVGAATQRTYQVAGAGGGFSGQGGVPGGCGVPASAAATEATITAVGPVGDGFDRAWPAGTPLPNATFLNYSSGESIGNTGTIPIATSASLADLTIGNFGGSTHLVTDVQGYFLPS